MGYGLLLVAAGALVPAFLLFAITFAIGEKSGGKLSGSGRLLGFGLVWGTQIVASLVTGPTPTEPHPGAVLLVPLVASIVALKIARRWDQGAGGEAAPEANSPGPAGPQKGNAGQQEAPAPASHAGKPGTSESSSPGRGGAALGRYQYKVRPDNQGRFQVVDGEGAPVEVLSDQEAAIDRAVTLNQAVGEGPAPGSARPARGAGRRARARKQAQRSGAPQGTAPGGEGPGKIVVLLVLLVLLGFAVLGALSQREDPEVGTSQGTEEWQENVYTGLEKARGVYERVEPSVVRVSAGNRRGTGVAIGPGFIVTANHVVNGRREATVVEGGRRFRGRVVEADGNRDLALVYLGEDVDIAHFYIPQSDAFHANFRPDQGSFAVAIGPADKYAWGSIQGVERMDGVRKILASTTIEKGASGGPLVDEEGRLLGVVVAHLKNENRSTLAVSAREVTTLVRDFAQEARRRYQ